PGIGKTTIWEAGVRSASARGLRVLAARPTEAETSLAYAGLTDLLADIDDDAFAALPAPQRHALDVALLRAVPEGSPPDPRSVFAGFGSVLETIARERPVLVAVDDLQWLDGPSARALDFVGRRLRNTQVVFLAAARTESGAARSPGWVDEDERLRLRPLGPGSLHE